MYGKLFAQMYDGTLGTKGPWQALVTFQQLIILADKNGDVDMTAEAIARRTTIPLDVVKLGIAELEKPDPHSRSPAEEGRRIVRLAEDREWGWRVVNYGEYRKIRSQDDRREYMKQYQRARRAKLKEGVVNQDVNTSTDGEQSQPIAVSSRQEAEVEVKATTDMWDTIWQCYPKRSGGNSQTTARKAFLARVRAGVSPDEMLAGVRRYAAYAEATGRVGTEYVKQGSTFFGPGEHWREPWTVPATKGEARANGNHAVLTRFLESPDGK